MPRDRLLFRYRLVLGFFIIALIASGVTAFPLQQECSDFLTSILGLKDATPVPLRRALIAGWSVLCVTACTHSDLKYPWLAYGTDWAGVCAYYHCGLFHWPVSGSRVRNIWVLLRRPDRLWARFALAPHLRGAPWNSPGWRLIDLLCLASSGLCHWGIVCG